LIRIGTRASALALAQARWVAARLNDETELVPFRSSGPAGDKSRWVAELERALLDEEIDVAVHSAKDVPAELPAGLELIAIPEREDPRDAICGAASLRALEAQARVGTSSLRRAAQIRALRPDLEVVEVHGNVDTRLRKLEEGQFDALVLACAGLHRLGKEPDGTLDELVPAAGQGALALEARPSGPAAEALTALADRETAACVTAERELTRALGASCNTPVGAHARAFADGQLELRAWVGVPDGSAWLSDRLKGGSDDIGRAVASRMIAAGADALLRAAERAA
jgi:hydroxymethylbilane synthase